MMALFHLSSTYQIFYFLSGLTCFTLEDKIQRKLDFFLANFNLRAEKNVVVRCMFIEQEMLLFVQFL